MEELVVLAKDLGFKPKTITTMAYWTYPDFTNENMYLLMTEIQKWLRDEKGVYLNVELDQTSYPKYCYSIYIYNDNEWTSVMNQMCSDLYRSFEEALENGVMEALKIIKK